MPKKWHIGWALNFLMKKWHDLTLCTHTINKILTLHILIINKFHHNNVIHHNRRLILITTRKSLPLVLDKVRPHIAQVLNIPPVFNITTSAGLSPLHPTSAGYSIPTPDSSVPESPIESENYKRRKRALPTYDAPWWRYYE
jgi:hypothetical protein